MFRGNHTLAGESDIVEIVDEDIQVCDRHKHFKRTHRLPCGDDVCLECLFAMEAEVMTYASERHYSRCSSCHLVVLTASVKDAISKIKKVDSLPLQFTGKMCREHTHNEICITMPCLSSLCVVCVISLAKSTTKHFVNRRYQRSALCFSCHSFIAHSVLEKTLEELGNQIDRLTSPFPTLISRECCSEHRDLKILASLPCGRKVCYQCLCDMENDCFPIQTSAENRYLLCACSCRQYIWREVVTQMIKGFKDNTNANSMTLMSVADIKQECFCVEHKHSKYLAKMSSSKKACLECLIKLEVQYEKPFEDLGSELHNEKQLQQLLNEIDKQVPKDMLNPCRIIVSDSYCEFHSTSKIKASLPCDSYLCKDCLKEMETSGQKFCKCPCGENILCSFISETLQNVKERETDEMKQNPLQQEKRTVGTLSLLSVDKFCTRHKHVKVNIKHKCGYCMCYKCCRDLKNYLCANKRKRVARCPGCKDFIDCSEIDESIKQTSKNEVEGNWIKIIESDEFCRDHKHNKICVKFPCDRKLCIECCISLDKILARKSKDFICVVCKDVMKKETLRQWLQNIPAALREAITIIPPAANTKCNHHSNQAIGVFPCGEALCHQCFRDLIKQDSKLLHTNPTNNVRPKTIKCKNCGTSVLVSTLEEYWKTHKANEGVHFERVKEVKMCTLHKHHKICTSHERKAQCKICMKITLRECHQNPSTTFFLNFEPQNAEDIDTMFADLSEKELFKTTVWPRRCTIHSDDEFGNTTFELPCGLTLCYHCLTNILQKHEIGASHITCPQCNDEIPVESLKSLSTNISRQFQLEAVSSDNAPRCNVHCYWKICCKIKLKFHSKAFCIFCIQDENMCRASGIPSEAFAHFKQNCNPEKKYRSYIYSSLKLTEKECRCRKHKHWNVVYNVEYEQLCLRCFELLETTTIKINNETLHIAFHGEKDNNAFFPIDAIQHVPVERAMVKIEQFDSLPCTSCGIRTKTARFPCGAMVCFECYEKQKKYPALTKYFDGGYACITCVICQDIVPCHVLDSFFTTEDMIVDQVHTGHIDVCQTLMSSDEKELKTGRKTNVEAEKMDRENGRCQHPQHRKEKVNSDKALCKLKCGHWYCSRCITLITDGIKQRCSICRQGSVEEENRWIFDDETTGGEHGKDMVAMQTSEVSAEQCAMKEDPDSEGRFDKITGSRSRTDMIEMQTFAQSSMRKESDLGGIPNIGFTCYANSIFQILCQTPGFQNILKTVTSKNTVSAMLLKVLTDISEAYGKCYTSRREHVNRLMTAIFQRNNSFALFHQNDCHLFLISLLNELLNESKTAHGKEQEDPTALFAGYMTNLFSYTSCRHVDGLNEGEQQLFFSLLVPVPVSSMIPTIEKCLKETMKDELFHDNILPCRECNKPGTITTKQFCISKGPKILVLQIQRFQELTNRYGKWIVKSEMPVQMEEKLLVEERGKLSISQNTYELYGVVLHIGSVEGGHYYSLVRKAGTTQWYECSDSSVSRVKSKDIFDTVHSSRSFSNMYARDAYLLFYNRVGDDN